MQFTEFAVSSSPALQELIGVLLSLEHSDGHKKELRALRDKESFSLKEMRLLQGHVKAAKDNGSKVEGKLAWLHELFQPQMIKFPAVKSKLTPEEMEAQKERRKLLQARAAEREYQGMVAPLYRRATRQKRRQIFESKARYQIGVPLNMIAAAGTAFVIGYYAGMHYFNRDHSAALGIGCVLMFCALFVEMTLFTIRSL